MHFSHVCPVVPDKHVLLNRQFCGKKQLTQPYCTGKNNYIITSNRPRNNGRITFIRTRFQFLFTSWIRFAVSTLVLTLITPTWLRNRTLHGVISNDKRKAMPNQNSVKRPRARRFKRPQSNKKNKFVGGIFLYNSNVPGFRKNITIL